MRQRYGLWSAIIVFFIALIAPSAASGQGLRLIRDAEIEDTIRTYATPLFTIAGLEPSAVDIILVNDRALNAFVAGGQRLFMNSGLLMRAETPNQVIGVIAHEVGHISGGHLVRSRDALNRATTQQIVSILAGLAAAVASGRGDVGVGVLSGGQDVALRSLLQYSRAQESAADQAGVRYLDQTGQSSRGLLEFFKILGGQELLLSSSQDPYLRTHPLTRERVSFIESHVEQSRYSENQDTPDNLRRHARMRAKFQGFLDPTGAFRDYPSNDQSVPARYARSIAYYRSSDARSALLEIDS
ncbi:MAG: M48 family metalloprotease, partial [Pseudomonadota bacterium]